MDMSKIALGHILQWLTYFSSNDLELAKDLIDAEFYRRAKDNGVQPPRKKAKNYLQYLSDKIRSPEGPKEIIEKNPRASYLKPNYVLKKPRKKAIPPEEMMFSADADMFNNATKEFKQSVELEP